MTSSPASASTRFRVPVWLRVLLPVLLILGWLAAAGVGGPTFGKLSTVVSNDQSSFLPASAESTTVQDALPEFLGADEVPAIVVVAADRDLTEAELADLDALQQQIAELDGVVETSPLVPSEDGEAVQIVALLDSSGEVADDVERLRALIADAGLGDELQAAVTGPAGFSADIGEAFAGIDGILLLVALAAVLVILIIVYRSPLLPLLVLFTSVAALCLAILIVFELAKADVLTLSGQTQGILFILVVGAATDYGLLYTARFREALGQTRSRWQATLAALKGSTEPIVASGGTVIAGLLCLLLSDLVSNQQLGPVAAIGIACAIVAGLTLLPALLLAFGRVAFWPVAPTPERPRVKPDGKGLWGAVSRLVERRTRTVWIVTALVLGLGALGVTQLQAEGVPSSEFVVGESQARDGQALLSEHYPGGSGTPTQVLAPEGDLDEVAEALADVDGVDGVAVVSEDSPSGTIPLPVDPRSPFAAAEPTVVDGLVLVQATLADAPDSDAAQETVRQIRDAVHPIAPEVAVGGTTAIAIDTNVASSHDRALIIPIVLVVISLILMALLRSIVAALMLLVTTVLSYYTALGVGALILQAMGIPEMDPAVPLFAFVFLVALGVDYNIFLMTRVREEVGRLGHREGVLRGLRVTGGVITSAGVVLAATFAALGVIPVLFLLQLAIIVALGVLIDTTLVRSLLVPALALEIGPKTWWPSKLARERR
ncbi:MMPL family transporter [Agrococcus carbonis]|uniref:Putative drug exporter of the RND superfamily n=1 Tax=Agrococcus carbonis TaxID=684552 RepID=A0A1H1MDW2_9MICO|nr:MMPL family transporter [Agrococcus carbonis]SDR84896.1 putative drug exporter of the RND superfamily [Agrococcus carbonis]